MVGTGITKRVNTISNNSAISLSDKMTTARIELTGVCTLDCKFCYNHTLKKTRTRQKFLNKEDFLLVVKTLDKIGTIKEVGCFYMGESGLHPNLDDYYKSLKSRGYFTYLTTNGTSIKNILDAIPYIDSLKVSWNYRNQKDFVAKTRSDPGFYEIIQYNIKKLYFTSHKHGKKLSLSTVVDYGEKPEEYRSILSTLPYDEHYYMPVQTQCGVYKSGKGGVVGEFYHQASKIPCWSLFRGFYVDVDLNVRTCSYGHTDAHILGNIKTGFDLEKLSLKKQHLAGIVPEMCVECIGNLKDLS